MQKGILFTVMALVLIAAIIAVYSSEKEVEESRRDSFIKMSSFSKVSSRYDDVKQSVLSLPLAGAEKSVAERLLPFDYGIEGNYFSASMELPDASGEIQAYLETLASAKVFLEKEGSQDNASVDADFQLPISWGGNATGVSFTVSPQCLEFARPDVNSASFIFNCPDYNISSTGKIDINISLKPTNDFNAVSCSINGAYSCANNDFNSADKRPYINIEFLDQNCSTCAISQKRVRSHFNPSAENFVQLKCTGAGCKNPQIDINFSQSLIMRYGGNKIGVKYRLDLNSQIKGFTLNDANVSVSDIYFGSRRWNG